MLASVAAAPALSAPPEKPSFVGVWKGTSVCQIRDSPCHDELAAYTLKQVAMDSFEFAMNKVVDGKDEYMGTLMCKPAAVDELVCHQNEAATWTWKLNGDSIRGRLVYRGQLYRIIQITRVK